MRSTDAWRGLAAAGVYLSAVVHLQLWEQGFRGTGVIGSLFLVNAVSGLVLGTAILVWRHWLPALLGAGYGAVTVGAFWISVTHGLFGVREIATGDPELLAQGAEYAAVLFGLLAAALLWREAVTAAGATARRHVVSDGRAARRHAGEAEQAQDRAGTRRERPPPR